MSAPATIAAAIVVGVLAGCTSNAAKILQDENEYGSIQKGLCADIEIVKRVPLCNPLLKTNIEINCVSVAHFINGKCCEGGYLPINGRADL